MNPYIEQQIDRIRNTLKYNYTETGTVIEREIRFRYNIGPIGDNKNLSSGVPSDIFYQVMTKLKCDSNLSEYTQVQIYNDPRDRFASRRIIKDLKSGKSIYQYKKAMSSSDIPEYGLKIATSIEKTIQPFSESSIASATRNRTRCQKNMGNYIIHLTKVETLSGNQGGSRDSYEIEVELGSDVAKKTNQELNDMIISFYKNIYDTVIPISHAEMKMTINEFNQYLATPGVGRDLRLNFQSNKPIDMDKAKFVYIKKSNDYTSSLKVDGIHGYLMITRNGVYLLNSQHIVNKISETPKMNMPVIMEGEIVTLGSNQFFLAYDLLVFDDKSYIGSLYEDRFNALRDIVTHLANKERIPVAVKKVLFNTDASTLDSFLTRDKSLFYEVTPKYYISKFTIISAKTVNKFNDDGLIFTNKSIYTRNTIYKWKPIDKLTIDFTVNHDNVLSTVTYDKRNRWVPIPVPFRGSKTYPFTPVKTNKIHQNQVAEFKYNTQTGSFNFIRNRWDKTTPNETRVAENMWAVISDPVSSDTLRGNDMTMLRKYHNIIKKKLIDSEISRNDIVLDIGGGRGGDIDKYISAGVSKVIFVEPNKDNLDELRTRLSKLSREKQSKFLYIQAMGQETEKIRKFLNNNNIDHVDVVSLFFSLTFFFETRGDLAKLVNTICETLKPIGKIIGTVIDGSSVKQLLKNNDGVYNSDFFKIRYISKSTYTPQIEIQLPENTIVGIQKENLVNFDKFSSMLKKDCQVKELSYKEFLGSNLLSKAQLDVNSLYKSFVLYTSKFEMLAEDETEYVANSMYRIGVIGDGSCFVHAMLRACCKTYINSSNRQKFVKRYRASLTPYVKEFFPLLGNGVVVGVIPEKKFTKNITSDSHYIHAHHIEVFCRLHKINIVVISGSDLNVLTVNGSVTPSERSLKYNITLVMFHVGGNHYEIMYRKLTDIPCMDFANEDENVLNDKEEFIFRTGDDFIHRLVKLGKLSE